MYTEVRVDSERQALLTSDADVRFILDAFGGDVFNGLGAILDVFHEETDNVLTQTHLEIRLLTFAYIAMLTFGLYWYLFRRTLFDNLKHAKKTKEFVHALPAHTMHGDDVQSIIAFFVGVDKAQEDTTVG
mmetsp:Transcript_3799/g.5990  ORF Transcript_3799/g.5990 Transcript_3799/m.5990 type:complete len:130 (+) Transcript_3799:1214-1603(+)